MIHTTLEVSSLEELRTAFVDWLEKQALRDRNYAKVVCKLKRDQEKYNNFASAHEDAALTWRNLIIISKEETP